MRLQVRIGNLRRGLNAELRAKERRTARAMRRATDGLVGDLRRETARAGLGQRLASAWRARLFRNRSSIRGFIWTRAPRIMHGQQARGRLRIDGILRDWERRAARMIAAAWRGRR